MNFTLVTFFFFLYETRGVYTPLSLFTTTPIYYIHTYIYIYIQVIFFFFFFFRLAVFHGRTLCMYCLLPAMPISGLLPPAREFPFFFSHGLCSTYSEREGWSPCAFSIRITQKTRVV